MSKKPSVLDLTSMLTPEALKLMRAEARKVAREDANFKKEYVKTSFKVSADIRKEKLIAQNPEIVLELERRAADKEKKRIAKKDSQAKEEQRKQELRDARKARQLQEETEKAEKLKHKIALYTDANLSESTRVRIKKTEIYPRRHSDGTLLSVKVLVTYADLAGKYQFKQAIMDVPDGMTEDAFLLTAREELVSLLIDVENT
jgi:hypothetical protein